MPAQNPADVPPEKADQGRVCVFLLITKTVVQAMDGEGFGSCSNTEACEAVCPQEITTDQIARMNSEYLWARLKTIARPT